MPPGDGPPPLTVPNSLRELLAIPRVIVNPLRRAVRSERFGHGRPVLVIPGLLTGDISTVFLRRSLTAAGFRAFGWGLGLNRGASRSRLQALEARVAALHREHGQKVVLIGWSLGGLYARILGQRMPDAVELVMTVGSPFSGDRRANRAWRLYELINDHSVDDPPFSEDPATKPGVETIAVWSGVDGVVAPVCAMGNVGETDRRVRLDAQHFALGSSRRCVARIVEILAENFRALRSPAAAGVVSG